MTGLTRLEPAPPLLLLVFRRWPRSPASSDLLRVQLQQLHPFRCHSRLSWYFWWSCFDSRSRNHQPPHPATTRQLRRHQLLAQFFLWRELGPEPPLHQHRNGRRDFRNLRNRDTRCHRSRLNNCRRRHSIGFTTGGGGISSRTGGAEVADVQLKTEVCEASIVIIVGRLRPSSCNSFEILTVSDNSLTGALVAAVPNPARGSSARCGVLVCRTIFAVARSMAALKPFGTFRTTSSGSRGCVAACCVATHGVSLPGIRTCNVS